MDEVVVHLAGRYTFAKALESLHGVLEAVGFLAAEVAEQRAFVLGEADAEHRQHQQGHRVHGIAGGEELCRGIGAETERQGVGVRQFCGALVRPLPYLVLL